jgi:hypothetical protein
MSLNGWISYFGNALSFGYYPAFDVSRSFFGVIYVTVGGGAYIYRMGNGGKSQSNPWERLRLDINLARRFFARKVPHKLKRCDCNLLELASKDSRVFAKLRKS